MPTPALVIAGTHSGVGKTTISIALMAALRRRGLRVQPFKVGPDFIDPTLHARAAGRMSRNLDGWMLTREANLSTFVRSASDADIAVIEGVMGLFDGREGLTEAGSTAEMAKLLGVPVVLVIDASAMARSAAALVRGYESFDTGLDVAGVIFNHVAGSGHFAFLREAVESTCRTRVVGWLAREEIIRLPERHLGLVMADEVLDRKRLDLMADWVETNLDVDALVTLARKPARALIDTSSISPERRDFDGSSVAESYLVRDGNELKRRPCVGVARDNAFCFYYQDNLDLMASAGAEIVEFSPVADSQLPEGLDGLYFGGGYPELHAAALAANESMRHQVAHLAGNGIPIYAECGGLMYLTEAIVDVGGNSYPMVGVLPTRARMQPRLAALGYREVKGINEAGWLRPRECARGHEFRYSVVDEMPDHISRHYFVSNGTGEWREGFSIGSVLASYVHLHFGSCPLLPARFVAACRAPRNCLVEDVRADSL
jgi:cobyrinic acid a,c-diamide synthase